MLLFTIMRFKISFPLQRPAVLRDCAQALYKHHLYVQCI